ncbi:cell envelope integrity protein TolA [Lichenifustis flavocetrariae]|uniref:TonB family protein n=1 Tax=Lichenifustis flavocetrariae TaxID=2949735 RepID=A0AA41YXR7_9HYPH|nr:TonB family protein [Lichenifustis flavocetrariae]MCW6509206.1 TonB family protein [Lichenifustis flavocetrariae]
MTLHPLENAGGARSVLRWTAASLVVVATHAGLGWWVLTHPISRAEPPEAAQGITIALEPIATPENAPEPNESVASGAAPTPQSAAAPDAQSDPSPETAPPPPELTPPPIPSQPEPPPAPAPPPSEPAPVEEPKSVPVPTPEQTTVPPPPVDGKSDAVLAPPPSAPPRTKPIRPKLQPQRTDPKQLAREAAERKAVAERKAQERAARAEARAEARAAQAREAGGPANQDAAPSSASSGAAVATWRGAVKAHLDGYRPESPNGASGTARIAFSVDRSGRVLSATVAGSSGDGTLDQAAMALVRRASPVPAPPPELGGRISLVAPVRFH